jgi:DNA recombination protein RmuC
MTLTIITLIIFSILSTWVLINLNILNKRVAKSNPTDTISGQFELFNKTLKETEDRLKGEFFTNRSEMAGSSKDLREEVSNKLNTFTETFATQLSNLTTSIDNKFGAFQDKNDSNNKDSRKELKDNLDSFKKELQDALKDFSDNQRTNFSELRQNQDKQNNEIFKRLEDIKNTLENKITELQQGNEKKLDEMRKTVDEKLSDTLEKRLGESFKQVSDRLEAVHKGLGEMQNLATSVGDLKKVMTNVKSRGVLGEYQLQNLIEDLLTNEQYEKNVKTKLGSGALVEFAVKMPNGNNFEKTLWLPIDSKFPKEDYEYLVDAYEKGDIEKIEEYRKAFIKSIKKNAQDIKEKYIDPPNTTEYGIMFLPYESLFGEVLRTPGLFEQIQREYKITITGPTTLSALLNSLQMGFRTLAIEQRSSEVWDLLGAVKTEFGKFGAVLAKAKKKLEEATNVIDDSEVRTRVINRKLKNVQELSQDKTAQILEANVDAEAIQEEMEEG